MTLEQYGILSDPFHFLQPLILSTLPSSAVFLSLNVDDRQLSWFSSFSDFFHWTLSFFLIKEIPSFSQCLSQMPLYLLACSDEFWVETLYSQPPGACPTECLSDTFTWSFKIISSALIGLLAFGATITTPSFPVLSHSLSVTPPAVMSETSL